MVKVLVSKQSNYPVSLPNLKKRLKKFLTKEGIVSDTEISVSLIGEQKMRELSKRYLGESETLHSVLSFPFLEGFPGFVFPPDGVIYLGEVVVCFPKAVEEAKRQGKLIEDKVYELVEHGAMHLLGKHHE